jgi:hypothetical protein
VDRTRKPNEEHEEEEGVQKTVLKLFVKIVQSFPNLSSYLCRWIVPWADGAVALLCLTSQLLPLNMVPVIPSTEPVQKSRDVRNISIMPVPFATEV